MSNATTMPTASVTAVGKMRMSGTCHRCGAETGWIITHALVKYHGIVHCWECEGCGMTVPEFSWVRYQREGRVVIPV